MGKMLTIQKTTRTHAIKITSPEEEEVVRGWLADMFVTDYPEQITNRAQAVELAEAQELTPVITAGYYFARDEGSVAVYMIEPDEFTKAFEVVDNKDILGATSAFKIS